MLIGLAFGSFAFNVWPSYLTWTTSCNLERQGISALYMCVVSLASIVGGKQKDWRSMKFIIPCSVSNVEVIWDSRRSKEVDEKLLWPKVVIHA